MKLKVGCMVNVYGLRDLDMTCNQTFKIMFFEFLLRKWFA